MSQTDPQAILEQVYPLVYRVDGEIIVLVMLSRKEGRTWLEMQSQ
jgi:hypothetical protein